MRHLVTAQRGVVTAHDVDGIKEKKTCDEARQAHYPPLNDVKKTAKRYGGYAHLQKAEEKSITQWRSAIQVQDSLQVKLERSVKQTRHPPAPLAAIRDE